MAEYKYLSLAGLQRYDGKIKEWVKGLGYALNSDLTKVSDRVTAIENTYATVTSDAAKGKTAYDALTVFMGNALAQQAPTLTQIDNALKTVTVNGKRLFSDAYNNEAVVLTSDDIKVGTTNTTITDSLSGKADWGTKLADYKIDDAYTKTEVDNKVQSNTDKVDNLNTLVGSLTVNGKNLVNNGANASAQIYATDIYMSSVATGQGMDVASQISGLEDRKADWGTKLADYKIDDAYTKGEVDDKIAAGIGAVKITVNKAEGTYIDVAGTVDTETGHIISLSVDETALSDKFATIDGWKINGSAITADTKLNAANLPMSGTDATTISTEIANIKSAIQGGTHFIGVLESLDGKTPQAGDIFVASKDFGTFKDDIEYIYDGENWYELGNSSANAQAIADLTANKADKATTLDGYGITDAYTKGEVDAIKSDLQGSINDVSGAAVKSIEGGNSTYVTVTAGAKDADGKVTLTVSDTIGTALEGKLDKTAKAADSAKLNGQEASYYATADSVTQLSGKVDNIEKDYVKATEMVAISDTEIDALFAVQA